MHKCTDTHAFIFTGSVLLFDYHSWWNKHFRNICLKILKTFTGTNFRLKSLVAGLVRKYQCPKVSENFNSIVNFSIYRKLKKFNSKNFGRRKSKTSKL